MRKAIMTIVNRGSASGLGMAKPFFDMNIKSPIEKAFFGCGSRVVKIPFQRRICKSRGTFLMTSM